MLISIVPPNKKSVVKIESFFFEFPFVVRLFAREDANHQVCIAGLTERHVHNVEELMEVGTQIHDNRFGTYSLTVNF